MIKQLFKRITGIEAVEKAKEAADELAKQAKAIQEQAEAAAVAAVKVAIEAQAEAEKIKAEAEEKARIAKLTPKERATELKEPWVAVLDTKVNPENPRNGFFELDWNEYFILQLKQEGYGVDGDPDEEIVDRWFRELTYNMFAEAGVDPSKHGAGYINITPISQGRAEVS